MHRGLNRHVRVCLLAGGALPSAAAAVAIGVSLDAPNRPDYTPPPRRGRW
jgi:hypothetical protein